MEGRVLFSLDGLAARYPLGGPPLWNPLPPFAFQNLGVGCRIRCYNFNSSSIMQILANGTESVGRGPRPFQIEWAATA